ncbi:MULTISPECIES: low specificity L-threonine aldolase [Peptoniphilus]|jgi:putative threonine aldolase, B subunit|uniref:threonine aldolase family protein n=1 Tax=Peptoniphilus TaxID=162289 RepID=UPI000288F2CE|nr:MULTISPECIES: aminotransferase class I/II-fold pyridoxal phosphate-dependent enzyme [Peptoniphilus]MDU1043116.1 aminotransferase class I/II-fold pyridoxal phosphate-dependent enzyme [Peptoniphilus rhinitidis]MDU1955134.1 aminotransferase class I/II-fold pyridoxal phosphate-dependent enzyme [Peptoniphilus lacydonensis]MDU2109967.1 aminotransferase class I/II-fold pyridoxal phosphate-dependent enzyme [Peptoniphilus lacydonensis]MDU2114849.1 aminotransferase class I/II-fold pyridoxal phosphate-
MNNFLNDYNDFGSREIYEEINKIFDEKISGYGLDEISNSARKLILKEIDCDADIEFVSGGTATNILATTFALRPFEAVLSASTGHITHHETGSIEATGHKVVTIENSNGKLKAEDIKELLENQAGEIDVKIKVVYISQTTELGTVYSVDEIREIYKVCEENNLYLYIDGARIAHAMAANNSRLSDYAKYSHIFSIGGTKNGAIFGEALVILDENLRKDFRYYLKQRGAMMAKSFLIGLSFKVLFQSGLYYENANKAYKMSRLLFHGLSKMGREPLFGESNQIFIKSNPDEIKKLQRENIFEIDNKRESIIRLVTNYRTEESDVIGFLNSLDK